ncbi:MAG TPA: flavodoxin-dependent (E)-4-hydroxy-3-methylbut-2-enyl-diphosphate synthase [Euzebyales bacterium]
MGTSLPILTQPAPQAAAHQPPARRACRTVHVGDVAVGGDAPISVQSMTTTPTHDINATLQQIAALNATGVDIVRVAVPRQEDADALAAIAAKSTVPVVADIHFQWKYAMAAIEAGCAGVRINPGNIRKHDKVKVIGDAAKERGIPIRIGVNGGSLEDVVLAKYGGVTPEAMVESALAEARLLEEVDFYDIKISVKHSDPWVMIQTYRLLAESCDYPLHLGVTEAGPPKTGITKSAVGIGTLLAEGIGDTVRVSLTPKPGGDRREEVYAACELLQALGLRSFSPSVTASPGCGRTTSSTFQELAERTQDYIRERMSDWKRQYEGVETLTLAVMGCVVNGPGESRAANIGISLPGTGEAPTCPVYIDGVQFTTLTGTYEELAEAFRSLIENYVATHYLRRPRA